MSARVPGSNHDWRLGSSRSYREACLRYSVLWQQRMKVLIMFGEDMVSELERIMLRRVTKSSNSS